MQLKMDFIRGSFYLLGETRKCNRLPQNPKQDLVYKEAESNYHFKLITTVFWSTSHCKQHHIQNNNYTVCISNIKYQELSAHKANIRNKKKKEGNSPYQWGFTQQFTATHKVANGHVEVGVATAPVGNLCEGVGG